jgi:hypothetical protein
MQAELLISLPGCMCGAPELTWGRQSAGMWCLAEQVSSKKLVPVVSVNTCA